MSRMTDASWRLRGARRACRRANLNPAGWGSGCPLGRGEGAFLPSGRSRGNAMEEMHARGAGLPSRAGAPRNARNAHASRCIAPQSQGRARRLGENARQRCRTPHARLETRRLGRNSRSRPRTAASGCSTSPPSAVDVRPIRGGRLGDLGGRLPPATPRPLTPQVATARLRRRSPWRRPEPQPRPIRRRPVPVPVPLRRARVLRRPGPEPARVLRRPGRVLRGGHRSPGRGPRRPGRGPLRPGRVLCDRRRCFRDGRGCLCDRRRCFRNGRRCFCDGRGCLCDGRRCFRNGCRGLCGRSRCLCDGRRARVRALLPGPGCAARRGLCAGAGPWAGYRSGAEAGCAAASVPIVAWAGGASAPPVTPKTAACSAGSRRRSRPDPPGAGPGWPSWTAR